MPNPVLETIDLTRAYRDKVVVDALSLTVEPGEDFAPELLRALVEVW